MPKNKISHSDYMRMVFIPLLHFPRFNSLRMTLGERNNQRNNLGANGTLGSYNDPEFSRLIAEELFDELQKIDSLEDGYSMIHKAIEFVKSSIFTNNFWNR